MKFTIDIHSDDIAYCVKQAIHGLGVLRYDPDPEIVAMDDSLVIRNGNGDIVGYLSVDDTGAVHE